MSEDKKYDVAKSTEQVGALYPVIVDAENKIIDGFHRLSLDPNWPVFKLPHIRTKEQFLMARIIANLHRREVTAQEKSRWLMRLASETGWTPKEIAEKLGMSVDWVRMYLPDEHKDREMQKLAKLSHQKRRSQAKSAGRLPAKKSKPHRPGSSGLEFVYDPQADESDKYLDGLNMWFLPSDSPVLIGLSRFCKEKMISWSTVVEQALAVYLQQKGYL